MIVYKITNLINNKIYIGKSKYNKCDYYGSGVLIKKAINKYGINNFKKEIVEDCNNNDELNKKERFWINKFNSIVPNGYNIAFGGEGGDNFTNNPNKEKIKEKISNILKTDKNPVHYIKNKKLWKKHISESKINPSKETIEKMSIAKKDKSWEEIYGIEGAKNKKIKMSIIIKNICKTPEEKERRSKVTSGKNNGMYGIHRFGKDAPMYGKKQPKEKCIYCGKECSKTNIIRFHNKNCKLKIN